MANGNVYFDDFHENSDEASYFQEMESHMRRLASLNATLLKLDREIMLSPQYQQKVTSLTLFRSLTL